MSAPFIAQISIFPYNFTPQDWASCDGQLAPISQNQALFSLIGNVYGGDGFNTMGFPNLKGRTPIHSGTGPGLSYRQLGSSTGFDGVVVTDAQMPVHKHALHGGALEPSETDAPTSISALGIYFDPSPRQMYADPNPASGAPPVLQNMHQDALASAGSGQVHENMQPYLGLPFMIALDGIYPPRS